MPLPVTETRTAGAVDEPSLMQMLHFINWCMDLGVYGMEFTLVGAKGLWDTSLRLSTRKFWRRGEDGARKYVAANDNFVQDAEILRVVTLKINDARLPPLGTFEWDFYEDTLSILVEKMPPTVVLDSYTASRADRLLREILGDDY